MNGRIDSGLGQIVIDTDVIASLKHGISVTITDENKIRLNFHVIVAYGVNISTIADNLVSNVKYKVEDFTGMEIEKINIYVEGVRAID